MLREIVRRLGHLGRASRFERELDEEIRFHIEARVAELEQSGLSRGDAEARARREFGSRARSTEDTRAAWNFRWIEDAAGDLRYAVRSFTRRPAFALAAAGCLALGIGANALIFSLVNAVLLRALPYPDAGQIVMVRFSPPNQPEQRLGTNPGSYFFIRERTRSFQKMGAVRIVGHGVAPGGEDPVREWVQVGWTSPGLTDVMAVQPMLGRWFTYADRGFHVVISHGIWQRMYGSAPDVVGKQIYLDGGAATVSGVMPPRFQTLNPDVEIWRPQWDEDLARARRSPNRVFNLFARLNPGVTVEQARAEMATLSAPLGEEMEMNRGWTIQVDALRDVYVGSLRRPLLVLQGAVLLVLLIACANVAALLLAQAAARQKEIAMRAALGSGRWRIVRQLLTENLLLSLTGGVLGVALAWAGLRMLVNQALAAQPYLQDASLDWNVLMFTLLISAGTGLVFGVLPAFQISRFGLMDVMRDSTRSVTAGSGRRRLRGAFVVMQVALALVLLAGAGLLIRTLVRLNATGAGLDPRRVVALQIPFPRSLYRSAGGITPTGGLQVEFDSRFAQLSERVRERLAAVPGVESASAAVTPPLGGDPRRIRFTRPSQPVGQQEQEAWSAEWYPVSPGYFETLRIPLERGRAIGAEDAETARPVAVINASLARRFFPNEDPVGQQIRLDVLDDAPRVIVGVVGDVRQDRFQSGPQAQMYVPRVQLPHRMDMTMSLEVLVVSFLVRSAGDPAALVPALRAAISEIDRNQTISGVRTVEEYAAGQLQDLSQYAALLSIFGAMSVALAVIGIFGVMAHAVNQRTNEIGIRLALGAQPGSVRRLVLREGLVLILAGLLLGLAASLLLTPVIQSFLWGVAATDPLTFLSAGMGLALVATLACYLPARRASQVDPLVALRSD